MTSRLMEVKQASYQSGQPCLCRCALKMSPPLSHHHLCKLTQKHCEFAFYGHVPHVPLKPPSLLIVNKPIEVNMRGLCYGQQFMHLQYPHVDATTGKPVT